MVFFFSLLHLGAYFDEISTDTGRICFGVVDTVKALEMGAVETLIVWENLAVTRYELQSNVPERANTVLFLRPDQETDKKFFVDEVCVCRGWGGFFFFFLFVIKV